MYFHNRSICSYEPKHHVRLLGSFASVEETDQVLLFSYNELQNNLPYCDAGILPCAAKKKPYILLKQRIFLLQTIYFLEETK
jgi:hypothetical protein